MSLPHTQKKLTRLLSLGVGCLLNKYKTMAAKFIIGIDLGGTNLKIAVLDLKYKLTDKEVLSTQQFRKKENLIAAILYSVNRIIENNKLKKGISWGLVWVCPDL